MRAVGLGIHEHTTNDLTVRHVPIEAESLLFVFHQRICRDKDYGKDAQDRAYDKDRIKFMHRRVLLL